MGFNELRNMFVKEHPNSNWETICNCHATGKRPNYQYVFYLEDKLLTAQKEKKKAETLIKKMKMQRNNNGL